jgi:UDP-glucose 4-epimerase
MNHEPLVLVLGASGFIGFNLTRYLLKHQIRVRAFDVQLSPVEWEAPAATGFLELQEASIFDKAALNAALRDATAVVNCTSFSVPSTLPLFLGNELKTTVAAMDVLLTALTEHKEAVLYYISSGGAVYGDTGETAARESDPPRPASSYAMGKLLCEEMIGFYGRVHGLRHCILRVANVYGAVSIHRQSQGVVDVFLEKALLNHPLVVWGNPDNVRDYVFIDDLLEVFGLLLRRSDGESRLLNVGTGAGTSVREIIRDLERALERPVEWKLDQTHFAGVARNVLNASKLRELTNWTPAFDMQAGLAEMLRRKRQAGRKA